MSLLPTGVVVAPGNNYFVSRDAEIEGPSAGVRFDPPWTPSPGSTIGTVIQVPGLIADTPVTVTLQAKSISATTIADAQDCWLITSQAVQDRIYVYCYAGGSGAGGAPLSNTQFGISWSVNSTN